MELPNFQANTGIHQLEVDSVLKRNGYPHYFNSYDPASSFSSLAQANTYDSIDFTQSFQDLQSQQFQLFNGQNPRQQPQFIQQPNHETNQHDQVLMDMFKTKANSLPELKSNLSEYHERSNSFLLQPQRQESTPFLPALDIPMTVSMNQYPDMTTFVNVNSNIALPMVDAQFVDHKVCSICGKRITRDMSRHMRTHQPESRFTCKFPKSQCRHKSGKFNRPYDYKKHLLNRHFTFDNVSIKGLHNLSDKVNHWGVCACGLRFTGKDWLKNHILTDDVSKKCTHIEW